MPGTTDDVVVPALEKASREESRVRFWGSNESRILTEGQALRIFIRLQIGSLLVVLIKKVGTFLEKLYECWPEVPRLKTNDKTAEMIKYTSNAALATMISFSNEIGVIFVRQLVT